jgi:hypothetical protein
MWPLAVVAARRQRGETRANARRSQPVRKEARSRALAERTTRMSAAASGSATDGAKLQADQKVPGRAGGRLARQSVVSVSID